MLGIVPIMQRFVMGLGFIPESIKTVLNHPAGPFTSKSLYNQ